MTAFDEMQFREQKKDLLHYDKSELLKAKAEWTEIIAYSHLIGDWYIIRCRENLAIINECLEEMRASEKESH
jgi:hypothetical protein